MDIRILTFSHLLAGIIQEYITLAKDTALETERFYGQMLTKTIWC